jgi:hypothetical protein
MNTKTTIKLLSSYFVIGITLSLLVISIPGIANAQPDLSRDNFGIVTEGDINIPGGYSADTGHVCSRVGEISLGTSGFTTKIPADGSIDYIVSAGNLVCGSGAVVPNARVTTITDQGGGCTDMGDPVACPNDPTVAFLSYDPGPCGIEICDGIITPGDYCEVIVPKNKTCTFDGAGDYTFHSFTARDGSKVLFNDVTNGCDISEAYNLFVRDFVNIQEFVIFHPNGSHVPVFINIEGPDTVGNPCPPGLAGGNAVFCNKGDGSMNVCQLFAPDGTATMRGRLTFSGWIYTEYFREIQNRPVTTTLPVDPVCCAAEPPEPQDCACHYLISPTTGTAGNQIALTGHGFRDDFGFTPPIITVDYIAFIPVGTPSIPKDDPLSAAACSVAYTSGNINIISDTQLTFTIPATCPAGSYNLAIINHLTPTTRGPWCTDNSTVLTVN